MRIVCATSMPYAMECFSTLGETVIREGRAISPADVRDAEILALRSTTKVNRDLLAGSRVRFVGTATIGYDHFDVPYLEQAGIRWCYAPGCNANSVSEYLTSALLCLAHRHRFPLAGKTVAVVGVGNVGRRVVKKAEALGLRVLQNDPPRRDQTGDPAFRPLDEILPEADIVTLHVPLTRGGPYPTWHMGDESFFRRLKSGCIFINSARGGAVVTDALLDAIRKGIVAHTVIDTWEGEPAYRRDLLGRVDIGTPHIAGHSFEGKVNGTVMVYEAACRFLGRAPTWKVDGLLPPPLVPRIAVDSRGLCDAEALWEVVRQVYNIEEDDLRLRSGSAESDELRAKQFDRLRKDYPVRREFPYTEVAAQNASLELRQAIARLGFRI